MLAVLDDLQSFRHYVAIADARSAGEQAAHRAGGKLPPKVAALVAALEAGYEPRRLAFLFGISAVEVEAFAAGFRASAPRPET